MENPFSLHLGGFAIYVTMRKWIHILFYSSFWPENEWGEYRIL